MDPDAASNPKKEQVRRLITAWLDAITAKDLDRIVADYAEDIILYDAIPPYKTVGKAAVRQAWASCLPHFPEAFQAEQRDLALHVSGDLAVAHYLCHFTPTSGEHPCGQTWMRITEGYLHGTSGWKVIHSHVSVPFNPMNNQAWFINNPDVVDQPDYGQTCM